jgi:hypothetical protein
MRRVKLNDKVTFPLILDLNPFIFEEDGANGNVTHTTSANGDDDEEMNGAKETNGDFIEHVNIHV